MGTTRPRAVARICPFAWVLLTVACVAHAEQFKEANPRAIERQIGRLTDADWRTRRQAVRDLAAIGPPVEMKLRELLEGVVDPEFRVRAEETLRRVSPMRRTEPALLTLEFDDVDAAAAFKQVASMEGAALPCDPPGLLSTVTERVTAKYVGRPYWEVVLDLCERTGLRLRCNEAGVTLVRPKKPQPPRSFAVSGMFLVTPARVAGYREVGSGVRISVYAEPRAHVLRGDVPFTLAEAVDTAGRSFLSEGAMNAGGAAVVNGYSWSAGLAPTAVPDAVIARCRGTARVVVAERFQTLEAPGFSSPKALTDPLPIHFSTGGVSASILRILNTGGGEYEMHVQLATDPAEVDWDALLFSIRAGGMRAFDVQGRELKLDAAQCDGGGPANNLRCHWSPRAAGSSRLAGQPFKLVWQVPSRTVKVAVPFVLRDVKLQ